jgi:hypothetical protein
MNKIICFLGAITHCDGLFAYGKFIRDDGQVMEDMKMPIGAFNVRPPPATVIIARANIGNSSDFTQLDLKFRTATLQEVKHLDSIEMNDAMNWIREIRI